MSVKLFSIGFIALCLLSGCQTMPYQGQARDVKKRREQGGVLALPINQRLEDRQVAEQKMQANCGSLKARVVEEGEVVVGTKSVQNARSSQRDDTRQNAGQFMGLQLVTGEAGGADTRTESSTEAIKEWQITYECEAAQKPGKK